MCRYVAYFGKDPIILSEILDKPENSLIRQSRAARETDMTLNGDGVGIAWYNHSIDNMPALYKSILPAWNDQNLMHLAKKTRSTCFLSHVRASTVGNVNLENTHPFTYQQYAFVHNGTIDEFDKLKHDIHHTFSKDILNAIQGQTDSEHLFMLLMHYLDQHISHASTEQIIKAYKKMIHDISKRQRRSCGSTKSRISTVLTDGTRLFASRYHDHSHLEKLTLYFTELNPMNNRMKNNYNNAILVASEKLNDCAEAWTEVPTNHLLIVEQDLKPRLEPLS